MTVLSNPANGHRIVTDEQSVAFWQAAGYQVDTPKAPAKKAASKKSSSTTK